jgi:hypothetical protein
MHEVLPGISGARAEGQARLSGQLPALQQAHHLRVRFRRPQHPKGTVERKTNQVCDRSDSQVAGLKAASFASGAGFRLKTLYGDHHVNGVKACTSQWSMITDIRFDT